MKVYFNCDIITMENEFDKFDCVVTQNGLIIDIGNKNEILSKYESFEKVDLNGAVLMPSFIDAHSHFSGVANSFIKQNLENCTNFSDISTQIQQFILENNIKSGEFVEGIGYDHENLTEKIHPTKEILDNISKDIPIVVSHVSGHVGVFNSCALDKLCITKSKNGYLEENDYINAVRKIPMPNFEKLIYFFQKAQEYYATYGITTIQDGMLVNEMGPIYEYLCKNNSLFLDVCAYVDIKDKESFYLKFNEYIKKYKNNFKICGYKIFLDGSPQAKTAFMLTPYLDNTFGISTMKNATLDEDISLAINDNMQLIAHCNGDAACEQFIQAIEKQPKISFLRPTIIHAQLINLNQLKRAKKYDIILSFFVSHIKRFGDIHVKNFGYERAKLISPVNSALKNNIICTFHEDSPVMKPNMLEAVYCAVVRKTNSNVQLADEEKISVYDALKCITINSAYQYFEENTKGSLKIGKNADFVILDKNPLKINPEEIPNIKILETIKKDISIFKI